MRISEAAGGLVVAAALLLGACGQGQDGADPFASADAERISCRTGDATGLEPVCGIERAESSEGTILTIRHPDGGFRRLLVTKNGITAADGAEPAIVTVEGGNSIVALGGDSYRLPATIAPAAP